MLGRLFRRRAARDAAPEFPPLVPEGLTYVIGDVHGRADLLLDLLDRIVAEAEGWAAPPALVFLGDYVDRGEESRATLDLLTAVADWSEVAPVFLMGNHERMLLDFLADPVGGARWLRVGGLQTLASYGVPAGEGLREPAALIGLRDRLAEAMGAHRAFVAATRPSHLTGNLLCAHAGADPDLGVAAQPEEALLWGHPGFSGRARSDGIWTIHGHVMVPEPQILPGRIAIDTGAYCTDRLTAARIAPGEIGFLATGPAV